MRSRVLPRPLHVANEGLAFLLELIFLGALAWWGAKAGTSLATSVLLGVGTPLAAALVWGLFASPRARVRLPMTGVLAVKVLAFAAGAAALYAVGQHVLAICFAVVALLNTALAAADRDAAMQARS